MLLPNLERQKHQTPSKKLPGSLAEHRNKPLSGMSCRPTLAWLLLARRETAKKKKNTTGGDQTCAPMQRWQANKKPSPHPYHLPTSPCATFHTYPLSLSSFYFSIESQQTHAGRNKLERTLASHIVNFPRPCHDKMYILQLLASSW